MKNIKILRKNILNKNWSFLNDVLTNNLYFDSSYLQCMYKKCDLFKILVRHMLIYMNYKYCYLYKEIPTKLKIKLN